MQKIILFSLAIILAVTVSAKKKEAKQPQGPKVQALYLYGVSSSFNDSIVYITDIQKVDSAYLSSKYCLGGIKEYVYQMNSHFNKTPDSRRTNTVFFKKDRRKAEKAYVKLRKRYAKQKIELTPVAEGDFKFKSVLPSSDDK